LNLSDDVLPFVWRQRLISNIQDRTNAVAHHRLLEFCRVDLNTLILTGGNHADGQLRHLANLLFKRHLLEQGLDLLRVVSFGSLRANRVLQERLAIFDVQAYRSTVL
jgi:hypothetical protein